MFRKGCYKGYMSYLYIYIYLPLRGLGGAEFYKSKAPGFLCDPVFNESHTLGSPRR